MKPCSFEQQVRAPWWWTVWLLRAQYCKCQSVVFHIIWLPYPHLAFFGRKCDGEHSDAIRLLLRRDHTVLQVHDFHQILSLIQPASWPWSRLWLGWQAYPIPFWGLRPTATGLQLWCSICQKVRQVQQEYSAQGSRIFYTSMATPLDFDMWYQLWQGYLGHQLLFLCTAMLVRQVTE